MYPHWGFWNKRLANSCHCETLKAAADTDDTPRRATSVECCFTSTETVGLLETGAQDGHRDFHTAPDLRQSRNSNALLQTLVYVILPSIIAVFSYAIG